MIPSSTKLIVWIRDAIADDAGIIVLMRHGLSVLWLLSPLSVPAIAQDNVGSFHSKHFLFGAQIGALDTNDLIIRDSYALSNNRETKFADWDSYRLTPQEVAGTVDLNRKWRADPWLNENETLEPSGPDDYAGASAAHGYQRGHQLTCCSIDCVEMFIDRYQTDLP